MIAALIPTVVGLLDKFIPDSDERHKLAHKIAEESQKYAHESAMSQIDVNKEEAKGNWFQSGWRPATGWICVVGLAMNFIVSPIGASLGYDIPQIDADALYPLLLGLLGLGSMRSFDKIKGTSK